MKKTISRIIRNKFFFRFWQFMNRLSLYGMNFGVASGYADYSGELFIIRFIKKHLRPHATIFDIGANVGDWSKFLIDEYKDIEYKIYMFEPSEGSFNELEKNIEKGKNKFFYQIGFGDKKETITIYYDNEAQGSAGAFVKDAKFSEEIKIETIDDFCKDKQLENIDFLKMDVQGYEYNILQGSSEMIRTGKIKFIQFEIDEPNIENRIFFKDFWDLLSPKYEIYHSLYNGLIKVEDYHYSLENFNCMNYLAISKEIKL